MHKNLIKTISKSLPTSVQESRSIFIETTAIKSNINVNIFYSNVIPRENMNPSTSLFIFFLFSIYSYSEACRCRPITTERKVCINNFVGVVDITGVIEGSNRLNINVIETLKNDSTEPKTMNPGDTRMCGLGGVPSHGNVIVVGQIREGKDEIGLSICGSLVETVSGPEDPKVEEFKNYLKDCPEKED